MNIKTHKLLDVCTIIAGQSPESKYYNTDGNGIPFFQGKADFGELYPTIRVYCSQPTKIAEKDDILLSVRAPVGPTNLAPCKVCIGRGLTAIRPNETLNLKYLLFYFRFFEAQLQQKGTGTTFKAITQDTIKNLEIPVPSLPEQERIVARIEELFSELDKSVETLKKTKTQLTIYRQAVLKEAFDFNGDDIIVTNLNHIISVLTDYHANGSYETLKANVTLLDTPDYAIMVRSTNYENNDFSNDVKYINKHSYDFLKKSQLFGNEVLMGKIGNAGRVYFAKKLDKPMSLAMNMFAMRFIEDVDSKYVYYYLLSPTAKRDIKKYVKGVGTPTIDKKSVRAINIKYPQSKLLQQNIVREIESKLSICDSIEKTVDSTLQQAEAMRQSILKQAFEGGI